MNASIMSEPVASWCTKSKCVTAVRIENISQNAMVLKPVLLRGDWLTAAFHHNRVLPAGHIGNSTIVYLVSSQPFDLAVAN